MYEYRNFSNFGQIIVPSSFIATKRVESDDAPNSSPSKINLSTPLAEAFRLSPSAVLLNVHGWEK